MNSPRIVMDRMDAFPSGKKSTVTRLARNGLLAKMAGLRRGRIELFEGDRCHSFGAVTESYPAPVKVRVHSPEFYGDIAFGGSIGGGESYMLGLWDCDDLVQLIRIMAANRDVLDSLEGGTAWFKKPFYQLSHLLHRNTVKGSRRNIHAHYDLGNDFFRLFLDDTMMYSSAVFANEAMGLKEASVHKLDLICRKLDLKEGDHILEIGTGWGGFAIHAASRYGCRVTTTTISDAQHQLAGERIREAGLEGRITLLKEDFRNLRGQYDKLVSIEMIEAIGEANIGTFFDVCNRSLKPGGTMVLQAITIADQLFASYRKSVDFIQHFIFPGGFLPSLNLLAEQIGKRSELKVFHVENIAPHYARTLRLWRENFHGNAEAILNLGYSREFLRLWDFYFCYCEAGFLEHSTGNLQVVLRKDG